MTREDAARILGVHVGASPDEVVGAWKVLAQQVHPDRGGTDGMFDLLTEAKETLLGNPREQFGSLNGVDENQHAYQVNDISRGGAEDEVLQPGESFGGQNLIFGMPRWVYISQVLGRVFSLRVIFGSLAVGVIVGVLAGGIWEPASALTIPVMLLIWLSYSLNPESPPVNCQYCRKKVKLGADVCHHCGRTVTVKMESF